MLNGLRLRNVRSLGDTGRIDFAPITLLLGQNSSGKSTFLRTLPLLKQGIRTRSNAPVLWYGDFVDFGSFREVISSFAERRSISFSFYFDNLSVSNPYYSPTRAAHVIDDVEITIELSEIADSTRPRSLTIRVGEDVLDVELNDRADIVSAKVNSWDMSRVFTKDRFGMTVSDLIPSLTSSSEKTKPSSFYTHMRPYSLIDSELIRFFSFWFDRRVSESTIRGLSRKLAYANKSKFADRLNAINSPLMKWPTVRGALPMIQGANGIDNLRAIYMIGLLPEILFSISSILTSTFSNLSYVGPSRATGERYYRHQELAIDQIDPQGQNLAMFLYSLPIEQRRLFSQWLEDEIGYSIEVGRQGGHVQIQLKERGGDQAHNLADMGYGFSQILPVMAQIWARDEATTVRRPRPSQFITIEQPELHLHPAYQAKLADVFANAISGRTGDRRKPRFVVETHSEALVNRLGELIYDKALSSESVAIYLFHRSTTTDATTVSKSTFDERGNLTNWPIGFFSSRSAA